MGYNKKPRTQLISFPSEFKPLIDKELNEKGFYTYAELMGLILEEHYGTKPDPAAKISVKEADEE